MSTKSWTFVLVVLGLAAAALSAGDANHADAQYAEYCEKVETWNNQSHLPPEQRDGWPPFKGECDD